MRYLILTTLAFLVVGSLYARHSHHPPAQITWDEQLGNARFIRFGHGGLEIRGNGAKVQALAFLHEHAPLFISGSTGQTTWHPSKGFTEHLLDTRHITMRQYHNGIPVFAAELNFQFSPQGRLLTVNGLALPKIQSPSEPAITRETALGIAQGYIQATYHAGAAAQSIELCHYRMGSTQGQRTGTDRLAFHLELSNPERNIREFLFVDALTGEIIERYPGVCELHREVYRGDFDTLVWQEGDFIPGVLWGPYYEEVEASGHAYHFFNQTFGFLSFDDQDAPMRILHNPDDYDCPGANWNGENVNVCEGLSTDDILAHEWSHAYTQYTSGLIYAWQSGAINESYSDIWGETIDLINDYMDEGENLEVRTDCGSSQRWLMGEKAWAFGGAIRDLWQPQCYADPGSVEDTLYHCGNNDSGGVHSNSGIPNRAYALLVDGGEANGFTIPAIGMTKAAHLFWRAQRVYLTSTSGFAELADALEASCADLQGQNLTALTVEDASSGLSGEVLNADDCAALATVLEALEFRGQNDCDFQPLLAQSAPEMCTTAYTFYEERFETGLNGWQTQSIGVASTWTPREWEITGGLPGEREGRAAFATNPVIGNCQDDLQNGEQWLISPAMNIVATEESVLELSFMHYVATESHWDGGLLRYRTQDMDDWQDIPLEAFTLNGYNDTIPIGDNPLSGRLAFTGTDEGSILGSWGESRVDVSMLDIKGGDVLQLAWVLGEDGCNGRIGWLLDDVKLYDCNSSLDASGPLSDRLDIYPNPFQSYLTLSGMRTGMAHIQLLDMAGREVFSAWRGLSESAPLQIAQLDYLPMGMYILRLEQGNEITTKKVLKW